MKLRLWLSALFLTLSGCASTLPPAAPAEIPPPPVVLTTPCQPPGDLPDLATGRELAEALAEWIGFGGCERAKRMGLLRAWPR